MQHMAANVGESAQSAGVQETELFIIKSHQIEDGCVDVSDVDLLADPTQTEFVGHAG